MLVNIESGILSKLPMEKDGHRANLALARKITPLVGSTVSHCKGEMQAVLSPTFNKNTLPTPNIVGLWPLLLQVAVSLLLPQGIYTESARFLFILLCR